ncbi:right-handed parallel beta-helix repeat-containing protein [Pelagicoccus mobilis]|uniref:Right-handed parallel beta-helix repeat-containing protein n=1 Tax=Pelagicoccus mobilis TaxID=415221 RepID=A0A934S2I5_9BACT|nr:right-handed parallel beta-helix repeat-containing protein [Pelagicoccus mobilis]MBK1879899.1 right-handed parallel beta-helix repeat-containing protein [Pelagicoccus mobilis]
MNVRKMALFAALVTSVSISAKTVFVSKDGSDSNPGTIDAPYASIQKAVDSLGAGDECFIRQGVYEEVIEVRVSGEDGSPIRIAAYRDEHVVIDGTRPLSCEWRPYRDGIFVAKITDPVDQLFDGRRLLTEARWPNADFSQRWDRSTWAQSSEGSRKEFLVSEALKGQAIDWRGAYAVLNVGQQFRSHIREVTDFDSESGTLVYDSIRRPGNGIEEGESWWDDYFYLFGKLEALDTAGEWFYKADEGKLYFKPIGAHPADHKLRALASVRGLRSRGTSHVHFSKIHFFASYVDVDDVEGWRLEECHFRFPTLERIPKGKIGKFVSISGKNNRVSGCSLANSQYGGFKISGSDNILENCVVRDVNWLGDISYAGIVSESEGGGSQVQNCTVSRVGNVGIRYAGHDNLIVGNHVFDTGKLCKDISAIHTGGGRALGSVCAYNWVHDSSYLGIRGDDQTRGLTVHHNVVWNTAFQGVIVKGDLNQVYNNTIFHLTKRGSLVMPTRQEPKKWWTKHEILEVQNRDSNFHNNAADIIAWRNDRKEPRGFSHNVFLIDTTQGGLSSAYNEKEGGETFVRDLLQDPDNWDFRPREASRLHDSGTEVDGLPIDASGKATDVGAYDRDGEYWIPGATWTADDLPTEHPLGNQTRWNIGPRSEKP